MSGSECKGVVIGNRGEGGATLVDINCTVATGIVVCGEEGSAAVVHNVAH